MSLIKWSPFFSPFENFDKFFDGFPQPTSQGSGLVPAVDVYDNKDSVVVETALPGVSPKDIELSVQDDVLSISGSTERKTEVDEKEYYRKEIRSGTFMRQVMLPSGIKGEEAKASFKDGILKIEIPKVEKVTPKTIKIDLNS